MEDYSYEESDDYEYDPEFDNMDTMFGKMDLRTCEWN